ncbi:putative ribonuclease H-like domain, reverse transcriptase zinc-binding [Sesbania bispinosa]|nr:putative ribonuclease H-like domain, reverse transcriptase zinc-binding [Sesbania bispinosa]
MGGLEWFSLFAATCWHLWRARNQLVHNHTTHNASDIAHCVLHLVRDSSSSLIMSTTSCSNRSSIQVDSSPPPDGYVKANSDGSVRDSGLQSVCGGVVRDHLGRWPTGASKIWALFQFL